MGSERTARSTSGCSRRPKSCETRKRLHKSAMIRRASKQAKSTSSARRGSGSPCRVRLAVRSAYLERDSARERLGVAERAVTQSRESHRITGARYEAGLASVTELLRSHNALLQAEVRHLGSIFDARLAAAALELATGTLKRDSEAMQP